MVSNKICSNCGQYIDTLKDYVNYRMLRGASLGVLGVLHTWFATQPLRFCNNDCLYTWLQRTKENKV